MIRLIFSNKFIFGMIGALLLLVVAHIIADCVKDSIVKKRNKNNKRHSKSDGDYFIYVSVLLLVLGIIVIVLSI